ncbi:MAG: hypothetical protein QOC96_241 [Acidobacteriota bacterium]|jgi:hypothetical protein|nr:hypothetical protein [Acidobacteriota bacterium]
MNRLFFDMRRLVALLITLSALAASSQAVTIHKSPAAPPFKITAIKAMLFYDGKGTFSDDILTQPHLALWNTIIGEGSAGSPSNSTLVLVEVSGQYDPDKATLNRKVAFTATAAKKVMLQRMADIYIGKDGKFYAAFWLYDTGCEPIKLSARIVGQSQPSAMTKTIPFKCGE